MERLEPTRLPPDQPQPAHEPAKRGRSWRKLMVGVLLGIVFSLGIAWRIMFCGIV